MLEPLQLADGFSPCMFDQLSFSPERDAPLLIRKNPLTNVTVAVSVPRLMALLTQHDILDYSQMLDFFFCYRSYITPGDLLSYLLARFSWALHHRIANPGSEIGRDVAVRTFVVLRHWILNFFPDDFVPRFQLRSQFCIGINKLYNWFRQNTVPGSISSALNTNHGSPNATSDIAISRIFEQLKKCWTRLSAMYWPNESTIDETNVLALPLSPGGVFGGLMNVQKSNAPVNRRSTLLAFYKDSASPILSSPPPSKEVLPLLNGTIIGGGIPLNDSVTKNPSEGCDLTTEEINCIPNTSDIYQQFYLDSPEHGPTKKRSFLHKVLHKITKSNSSIAEPPVKSQSVSSELSAATVKPLNIPDDGIDLLSQQVLDELAVLLKEKVKSELVSSPCSDSRFESEGYTGRASFVDSLCIQKHFARSKEILSYYQSSERDISFDDQSSTNGVNIDRITKDLEIEMPHISNDSQESSAQISIVSERQSMNNDPKLPGSVYQSAESVLSMLTKSSVEEPHAIVRGLRRQVHLQNIHDAVKTNSNLASPVVETPSGLAEPRFSMITVDSIGTSIDTGSSSLNLSDDDASMISAFESDEDQPLRDPFPPGVDAEIAAELAAIPDDTPDDDAVRAALEKLEGVYLKHSKTERQKDPNLSASRDSRFVNLYSETNLALVAHGASYFENKTGSINIPVSDSYKSFTSMHLATSNSHNSNLYNAAFQSRFNIASLTRHDSTTSRRISGSTMSSVNISSPELGEYEDASESIGEIEASGTPRVMSVVPMNSPPTLKADDRRSLNTGIDASDQGSGFLDSNSVHGTANVNDSDERENSVTDGDQQPADPELSFFERSAGKTHVPFVLYYNTNVICDQLALIERDALAEVDWNELVELNWSKKLQPVRSWLSMLLERKYTGADLAISRFNLMVNWVKSEIVLTKDIELRAATIAKFIRMAQRAREMQNYATMMQLVLGLSSDLIQNRISEATWGKVSTGDMLTLKELISLISPMKNFQKLRHEISQLDPEQGCTPFIGIYLSDLTSNEERPAYLDQANTIINLDKLRTTATIVRSLMQCIEWSSNNGQYKLDYDLLAKCLYIHSLTLEEMDQCVREINSM